MYAVDVFGRARLLLGQLEAKHAALQLIRASSSVAANYRAACRARSRAEFVAKIGVVLEEADESLYWLEYLVDTKLVPSPDVDSLMNEAHQLVAIFTSTRTTARGR